MSQKKGNIDVNTIDLDNTELQKALQIISLQTIPYSSLEKQEQESLHFYVNIAATTKKKTYYFLHPQA